MDELKRKKNKRGVLTVSFGTLTLLGIVLIAILVSSGLYSKGIRYVWTKYLDNKVYLDAETAYQTYCMDYMWSKENGRSFFSHYYDELYDKKNTNFRFTCVSDDSLAMSGYYDNDEKRQYSAKYIFSMALLEDDGNNKYETYYFKSLDDIEASQTIEDAKNNDEDITISRDNESGYYEVNIYRNVNTSDEITIQVYIPTTLTAIDEYQAVYSAIRYLYILKYLIIFLTFVFGGITVYNLINLIRTAGHTASSDTIVEKSGDRIPYDLFSVLSFGGMTLLVLLSCELFERISSLYYYGTSSLLYGGFYLLLFVLCILVLQIAFMGYVLSTAVRIKSGSFFSNTILWRIHKGFRKIFRVIIASWKNIKAYIRISISFIIIDILLIMEYIALIMPLFQYDYEIILVMCGIMLTVVLMLFEICVVYNIYILETAIYNIADGELDYKIKESMVLRPFKRSVQAINHISDGLNEALKTQIRSEHFKTELITNVSHDIKTPLTSIMNYVGLLQQANVSGDEAKEYLEVLERQSGKLKKLIEDMIEASKASTGNLNIELSEINIFMMLEQAIGEYSDRFAKKGLTVKYEADRESTNVLADGKYLWRVFDNLLINIYKYAMENTRVYIEVSDFDNDNCCVTFKNISKYEIKVTPDELTERFVRGDKSRNTEGSGLGLSIARGIMESMQGRMYIDLDGDLYKAVIILKKS